MTCIAFDGTHIAADTLVVCYDLIVDKHYNKIHTFKKETVNFQGEKILCVVLAGELANITGLMADIKEEKEEFREGEYTAYIVTEENCYRVEHKGKWYKDTAKKWAIGSGGDLALSAMHLGKSAKEAVKHACKLDINSGGKISILQVRKAERTVKKAPRAGKLNREQIKKAVVGVNNV